MRRIYFVRHGQPAFPTDDKYCLGTTDLPLSALGRMQACLLGAELKGVRVFSSPLIRALDTARAISPEPTVIDGLREMFAGDWDGLSFTEIKKNWPVHYAKRGEKLSLPIPNSEDIRDGQRRFIDAVGEALSRCDGDVAIVAHTTVIESFISYVLETPVEASRQYRLPYGSYTTFTEDSGAFMLFEPARCPLPKLDARLCAALLCAAGTPERVIGHCRAVAAEALHIAEELNACGLSLDVKLVCSAAQLHDIARLSDDHAAAGARWLNGLGYGTVADVIRQHHDPDNAAKLDEAAVVFIADKLVSETGLVPLERRFAESRKKCTDDEALAAHTRRYAAAVSIRHIINETCEKELVL